MDPRPADPPLVPMLPVRGVRGAVVAPHHLATAAGLGVLRAGGSAVDAAIATNAALAVVKPDGCGLGGDAFWLVWDEAEGRQLALNGSGRSAGTLDAAVVRAAGHDTMPDRGPFSITVPGAVRSWGDAHRRFGRLGRDALLAPAIELATAGFAVNESLAASVEAMAAVVERAIGPGSAWASLYRPNGRPLRPGERLTLPALGATLRRLADAGFDDLYEGELAERQVAGLRAAGSPIAPEDLRAQRSDWGEPIGTDYRGVRVTTHAPNSQGVVALEILRILERFEPPPVGAFGPAGPDARWLHLGIEAAKLAWADRDASLADPETMAARGETAEAFVARVLDPTYVASLAARIDPRRAAPAPAARNPRGGGTIYLATVDADGNAVSLIESNYKGFGSGVADPGTGIHYHDRGAFFSLEPGHPNELVPHRRPFHTLMPGMLFREGRPWVVLGSMGGDGQPQIHAQVVSGLVDGALDVATAVSAPRWFVEPAEHFAPPVEVRAEPRFAPDALDALRALGHPVTEEPPFSALLGHCHAIELVDGGPAAGGSVAAATDPRSPGLPATW